MPEIKNIALQRDEMLKVLEADYDPTSRRLLGAALNVGESDLKGMTDTFFSSGFVASLELLQGVEHHALLATVAAGGRVRGENLRRELLLDGFGDTRDVLAGLVRKGVFLTLPNPGEPPLDVPRMIDQGTVLQRDLALSAPAFDALQRQESSLAEASTPIEGVERLAGSTAEILELNLLHLLSRYELAPLKLNRDGSPHRRALTRIAKEIVFPGAAHEAGPDVDVAQLEVIDYLSFLHAMALQLGMLEVDGEHAQVNEAQSAAFFTSPVAKRNRLLGEAFKTAKFWNEVDSFVASKPEEVSASLTRAAGEPLIGARGYAFSILRRVRFSAWKLESAVESLCALMDPPFLHQSLRHAQTDPSVWVTALLRHGLVWLGAVERGVSSWGDVLRFSARGRQMIGLHDAETPTSASSIKGMVVQPNFEIMVFLDAMDASDLYQLYRVAERVRLADRVATFKLTPESVQRGYSLGENANAVIAFLRKHAAVEVPESVTFQLHDWERVHQRLVVHHNGFLVRHHDPDALDLWLGQVKHDTKCGLVRLGPSTAYLTTEDTTTLKKLVDRAKGLIVDVDAPAAMLTFDGPLLATVDPVEADVVTMWELGQIGLEIDDAPPGSRQFSLDVAKIQKRWRKDALGHALEFLHKRAKGGLPGAQQILLQSQLAGPPRAAVQTHTTLIRLDDEATADLFARCHEFKPYVVERLGPRAFAVKTDSVDQLRERMIEIGFVV